MIGGVLLGGMIFFPAGFMVCGWIASRGDEERQLAAFDAGVKYERFRIERGYEPYPHPARDLDGDPDSELGQLSEA